MENDQPCRIEDVGSVKIRMFDEVKRPSIKVRFSPYMKSNLIFLSMLDSHGLKWSSKESCVRC